MHPLPYSFLLKRDLHSCNCFFAASDALCFSLQSLSKWSLLQKKQKGCADEEELVEDIAREGDDDAVVEL